MRRPHYGSEMFVFHFERERERESGKRKLEDRSSMAANHPQKQLLNLIRDFATEKSQGERRVSGLRNRIQELELEIEHTNADLEDAKCSKEVTEQELKGYEVELTLNEATIQALKARHSLIQDEIVKLTSDTDAIRNEEEIMRDEFLKQMLVFNKKIREFRVTQARSFNEEESKDPSTNNGKKVEDKQVLDTQLALRGLEKKLVNIISQASKEEQDYQEVQNFHNKAQVEKAELERKIFLMESVVSEMKELQELTRLTTELEEMCASLGYELQKRCVCLRCHLDNAGELEGPLQANE